MKYTQADIQPFIDACDAMARSKFILVDKRIGDILKSIATTKPVYNAIAEAMINFNWSSSWKMATSKVGDFVIPEDNNALIAFVFCLLKNVDANKVNINDVLLKYCSNDEDKRSSYVVFCEKTIIPFKQHIVDKLCGTAPKTETVQQPKMSIDIEVNNRLEFLVKDIKSYCVGLKKFKGIATKQEFIDIVDVFLLAIKKQDFDYYGTFVNILGKMCDKDKELKNRINGILEVLSHIKG